MEEKVRPWGVKVITRLEALAGLALIGYGLGLMALADIIVRGDLGISELGQEGLILYGSAAVLLGLLALLVALGTWSLREGGRRLALACALAGIFVPLLVAGLLGQVTFVFNLIVYPLVIYYLSTEEVGEIYR